MPKTCSQYFPRGEGEGVPGDSGKGTGSRASQVSLVLIIIKEGKTIVETEGNR